MANPPTQDRLDRTRAVAEHALGGARARSAATLAALLMDWHLRRNADVAQLLTATLDEMAPRFEALQVDTALLVPIYLDAARATGRPRWLQAAEAACDRTLRTSAATRAEQVHAWALAGAVLDAPRFTAAAAQGARSFDTHRTSRDHATRVLALVELFQADGNLIWLDRALSRADALVLQTATAGAEPCAQAALAFAKLAPLAGRTDLGAHADAILERIQPDSSHFAVAAVAAAWRTRDVEKLAVIGTPDSPVFRAMLRQARDRHRPLLLVAPIASDTLSAAQRRIPWLAHRGPGRGGSPKAYLCQGHACRLPARTAAALADQLDASAPSPRSLPTVR